LIKSSSNCSTKAKNSNGKPSRPKTGMLYSIELCSHWAENKTTKNELVNSCPVIVILAS
jgi:hypothetical protein